MFESIISDGLSVGTAAACTAASLGLGLLIAFIYQFRSTYTKNFLITLVLIPAIIQAVIMMVNGNIGTGVAVLGAFSLVRFRSVPGNSKEICCIFFAMAIGIATGIGQVYFAMLFTVVVCAVFIVLKLAPFGERSKKGERRLKVTVPEDLDFEAEFKDIFRRHTDRAAIIKIKTANMGSLFTVTYDIKLRNACSEKQMIDEIRMKNSNLPIVSGLQNAASEEL